MKVSKPTKPPGVLIYEAILEKSRKSGSSDNGTREHGPGKRKP